MRVVAAFATLLAALGCALAFPKGMPYLPPSPQDQATATATAGPAADADNATTAGADDDLLLNRFGDDGIYFAHAESDDLRPQEVRDRQVHRDITRGVVQLALGLDRALSFPPAAAGAAPPAVLRDNVVFSPLSVAAALAMVLLGSGGSTYDEVSRVLGLAVNGPLSAERDLAVHQHFGRLVSGLSRRAATTDASEALAALGVFVQEGLPLRARFRQVARQAYSSDVAVLDFAKRPRDALETINAWVKEKTRGRITDFLEQEPPASTRLILGSALYFNGQWQHPFPKETTQRRTFYVDGDAKGEGVPIDMMANSADLPYAEDAQLRCKVLGLPYKGGDVVMYLLLPHARGVEALRALEAALTLDALERVVASARVETDVIVVLPRMKLEYSTSLREPLEQLGLRSLFDAGAANLSQLLGTDASDARRGDAAAKDANARAPLAEPVFVNDVLHKVEVEVTEMGTVASAATLVTVTRDGSHRSFRADRPFLFFIRHQPTGLVLFWGSVVRPRPAAPVV